MVGEQLFINGKIFTSNPAQPYANAMLVRDKKIVWIGQEEEFEDKVNVNVVNLEGQRVLPGLIDPHMHPLHLANAVKKIACTPPLVHSIEELIIEIEKRAIHQEPETWIESWGYDEGKLKEGRAPNKWDLDKATTDIPVIVTRTCGHIASVNSKALELAGITKDTSNPPGGEIEKDEKGEPTGILKENAKDLVRDVMPLRSIDEMATHLKELGDKLVSYGITAIAELNADTQPINYIDVYNAAKEKGYTQRTVLYYNWEELKDGFDWDKDMMNRDNQIHLGGIKVFADGSVSGQTAWVDPPFLGTENDGISTTSEDVLLAAGEEAKKHGFQLLVHAMGEQAIDLVVNTFYDKESWIDDAPSVRVEHAAMPTKQAIERAAKAGIGFVPQPIFLYAEIESYLKNLGHERTKTTYPIQTMLDAGIRVAFSSDAPATSWADPAHPFVSLKAAVTRVAYDGTDVGQEHCVDIETAIILYTKAAQEMSRIPNIGQLAPGYFADFIVLDRDILKINADQIDRVNVDRTYMGGELVYAREKAVK